MAKRAHSAIPDRYQKCQATGLYMSVNGATHDQNGKRLAHSFEPGPTTPTKQQQRYHHWVANGYDGKPLEFEKLAALRPEYNMAATAEREKAPLRTRTAKVAKDFSKAHEGPREQVGTPDKQLILTPGGNVVREVHTKQDQEAVRRNQEKDIQMQAWRQANIGTTREFNTRTLRPEHLRERVTPEIFRQRGQENDQGRGNEA